MEGPLEGVNSTVQGFSLFVKSSKSLIYTKMKASTKETIQYVINKSWNEVIAICTIPHIYNFNSKYDKQSNIHEAATTLTFGSDTSGTFFDDGSYTINAVEDQCLPLKWYGHCTGSCLSLSSVFGSLWSTLASASVTRYVSSSFEALGGIKEP